MTPTTVAYAIGTVGMLVGVGIVLRLLSITDATSGRGAFSYLLIIPGAAAVMYALMAADVATIVVDGVRVPILRYVDWLLTTPVLVGYVAYTAGASRQTTLAVVAIDALMIVFGVAAVLTGGPVRIGAFVVSSICYLGLLWILYGRLPTVAATVSPERRRLYELLRNHVGLLWLVYPVMWAAGPLGAGLVSMLSLSLMITYVDVVAKVPYVYFVYQHRDAFRERAADTHEPSADAVVPTAAD